MRPGSRLPTLQARAFERLTAATAVLVALNILSGASVRLTDSGLGCANWPGCSQSSFTPPLRFHALVEFANRMVVTVLVVLAAATALWAWRRVPGRNDLRWLSASLVGGVLAEALIGAAVTYSKLNAYVVVVHFLVGMGLMTLATVLALRARQPGGRGRLRVDRHVLVLSRVLLGVLGLAVAAGAATTGAGPHAGAPPHDGQPGAKRIPVPLDDMVRTHSSIALVAGVLVLGLLYLLARTNASASVVGRAQVLLAVLACQGVIGYTQFFTHLPAALVAVHVAGATAVVVIAVWWHDGLSSHAAKPGSAVNAPVTTTVGPSVAPAVAGWGAT